MRCCLLLFLVAAFLRGQQPRLPVLPWAEAAASMIGPNGDIPFSGEKSLQFYTTENGLPNESILAMLQARDGYLWFTTYGGLVRFDGVRFQVFDRSNTPAIYGTTYAIFSLMEDREGGIWAGSWNGGAVRYHNGSFTAVTSKDGLPNNQVIRIFEDDQGVVWLHSEAGLARWRNGKVERVDHVEGEPVAPYLKPPANLGGETHLYGLWRTGHGSTGLQRFAYGKWSDIPLPAGERAETVRLEVKSEDSRKRLWYTILNRPTETFCVDGGRLLAYRGLPPGSFGSYFDTMGRLWITDRAGNTAVWHDGRATPIAGLSTSAALRVVESGEGSLWIGTLNQGLAHAPVQVIRSVRLPGGPEVNFIRPILQDRHGDIWVGSEGLTRIRGGRMERFAIPPELAPWPGDQSVWALWADPDGTVFLSNNRGPLLFRNGNFEKPEPALQGLGGRVNAILRDSSGGLWMGGDSARLFYYRDSKLTLIRAGKGLRFRGEIRALAEDKTGAIWAGSDAMLCRFRNGELSCFGSDDVLQPWRIRSILVDSDNVLWAGTSDHGILRVEGEQFTWIQEKDGLFGNSAAGILEDASGYFWIGCRLGIYRVKKDALNEFSRGRIHRVTSSFFSRRDGLGAADCTGFGQPKGFLAQDGSLWFPSTNGLAVIQRSKLPVSGTTARAQIVSCSLNQRPQRCDHQVSLPPGAANFEINYTSVNLVRSDQIQFRYRMESLDEEWVNAGTRRTAYYPYLPPGKYRFQVMAANSFGEWSTEAQNIEVTVRPYVYQMLWFRLLGAGLLIAAFLVIWRIRGLRYARLQAMQRAFAQQIMASQETERKRIAGELHDSLSQRLTVIKNLALLMSRPSARSPQQQIDAIAGEASQAIGELRQISHNLRPYQLDLLGLTKAIESTVTRSCEAAGIRADLIVDDLSEVFGKELEIHFYRIVQECINNIVKHSRASEVTVLVQRSASTVSLAVTDDGIGFSPASADLDGTSGGFGLTGISERARLLGGKASIRSAPGKGATVTVEIEHQAGELRPKGAASHA